MDIIFRVHQHQLDENDLERIDEDLRGFHNNKEIFRLLGAFTSRWSWNSIPKLHVAMHWTLQIREYGSADNYDTEIPERLHRHYVKNPYHQCSKSDPVPQMIIRLQRQENWVELRSLLERAGLVKSIKFRTTSRLADDPDEPIPGTGPGAALEPSGEWTCRRDQHVYRLSPQLVLGKRPAQRQKLGSELIREFGIPTFIDDLIDYIDGVRLGLSHRVTETDHYAIWTRCELHHSPLPFAPLEGGFQDVIRTQPAKVDTWGHVRKQAYFDSALVHSSPQHEGLFRYQPVRVRLIFQVPAFLRREVPDHLALVELFTPLTDPARVSSLPMTKPLIRNGRRVTKVIPLDRLRSACHLVPKYSEFDVESPTALTVDSLDSAPAFFFSRHNSYFFWNVIDHWRRVFSSSFNMKVRKDQYFIVMQNPQLAGASQPKMGVQFAHACHHIWGPPTESAPMRTLCALTGADLVGMCKLNAPVAYDADSMEIPLLRLEDLLGHIKREAANSQACLTMGAATNEI
ncbi:hypothetical protein FRC11_010583 [Ceratobasidium sp. 423]|nr:hypothetical protein FRC11_010583 [Ceratobasidium sp. 423]